MAQTTIITADSSEESAGLDTHERLVGESMRILESIDVYLTERSLAGLSESSTNEYRIQLHVLAQWLLSRQVIDTHQITSDMLKSYLVCRKQTCGQNSLCHQRSILHSWVAWLNTRHATQCLARHIPRVTPAKPDEVKRCWIDEHQVLKLYHCLRTQYVRCDTDIRAKYDVSKRLVVFGLLFGSGLRISEVANVRARDISLPHRELHIPTTKSSKPRVAVLSRQVRVILRLHIRLRECVGVRSQWLLISSRGSRYCPTTLARQIQGYAAAIGITLTSHTGRRYCITEIASVNPYAAQQQAGHADLHTTQRYIRESRKDLHSAVDSHDPLEHRERAR